MNNPYFPNALSKEDSGHVIQFYISEDAWWDVHSLIPRPRGQVSNLCAKLFHIFAAELAKQNLKPNDPANESAILALLSTFSFGHQGPTLPPADRPRSHQDDGRPAPRDADRASGKPSISGSPSGERKAPVRGAKREAKKGNGA